MYFPKIILIDGVLAQTSNGIIVIIDLILTISTLVLEINGTHNIRYMKIIKIMQQIKIVTFAPLLLV